MITLIPVAANSQESCQVMQESFRIMILNREMSGSIAGFGMISK